MLKKLRRRFIQASMTAFFAVIAGLLGILNIWNYLAVTGMQDGMLERIYQMEAKKEPDDQAQGEQVPKEDPPPESIGLFAGPLKPEGEFSPEAQAMNRFFVIYYNEDSQVEKTDLAHVSAVTEEEAVALAETVLAAGLKKKENKGYEQGYRYLAEKTENGTCLVFLNSERELNSIKTLLVITILAAVGSLALVFLLVLAFSRRAIAPYARNLEMQKQFITNASHELKTPLTSILTSADVLEMEYEQDEWVENIQSQGRKLSRLIQDLVTLSRLNEERPFVEKTEFSLSEAVWEIVEPFQVRAKASGRSWACSIQEELFVKGDQKRIPQMVSVLLDNALKYADENGAVTVDVFQKQKKALICVGNTSRPGEKIETSKIFERFYRADESHSGKVSGSGIGLSIARAAAKAHGGSIKAEQKEERIVFTVKLPCS